VDPVANDGRVREVPVARRGRSAVPAHEVGAKHGHGDPRDVVPGRQIGAALIEPARGRVAVDDLLSLDGSRVCPAARAAEHNVCRDLQAREGRRQEWQRQPVMPAQRPNSVERRHPNVGVAKRREGVIGLIHRGVERRIGKSAQHRQNDTLGSAALGQVVVDDGDVQRRPRCVTSA
jgi:hypothetical protein